MALPKFLRTRTGIALAEHVRRLEDAVGAYALALTGERGGLLSHGLTVRENSKGRVYTLKDVTCPDDWTPWAYGTGWSVFPSSDFGVPAWQKGADGRVRSRGLIQYTLGGAPGAESLVVSGGPPAPIRSRVVVDMSGGHGLLTVNTNGSLAFGTGTPLIVSLADIEYEATDRSPAPWPAASQPVVLLGEDYPGTPEVVRVEDAVTETGVHLGPCAAAWKAETVAGRKAVRLLRVAGLTPGVKYTLTLAVLAA